MFKSPPKQERDAAAEAQLTMAYGSPSLEKLQNSLQVERGSFPQSRIAFVK